MSEPDFDILSVPEVVAVEIDDRIESLRKGLQHRNAEAMREPLRRLMQIRGSFAFNLISSIAWAAETVCGMAADDHRLLNAPEVHSLGRAIDSMDRARRTAMVAIDV